MNLGFRKAKILSYDKNRRTAKIHIPGLTDGASDGLTATFAYPVGDSDKETEREINTDEDVYIFFDNGEVSRPVIAFFSSHGTGAVVDTRRIRQENIELLARTKATIEAPTINLKGKVVIEGDIEHTGNQTTTGKITATEDVVSGGKSLKTHVHGGVQNGGGTTSQPI
ncbi:MULTISPECIES: hypothetical protein [unclassified Acinetobacter]|uniref:hypothetical protein n=1 Tax=unclassified Acinetobacter TaxID=196816 RepID=UPI002448CDAC|nr:MULTISPECIES: hypothetical protein [unclassified Acinetobacter]MDH0032912.1 hypothetical protein [Acinetobacter sp. GD04021]MDH0887307.1 hypothetical protein [Acinetobacter sp. GD03873]MDH1084703.1 hypothetical protein [Acinetobacter sp. GD03983]MDH2190623.1 hypothetical protein [Acinetobacter sp. GD03645]MDH2205083.1 hypothetical protein [Acinetobacter sp. GD03647]